VLLPYKARKGWFEHIVSGDKRLSPCIGFIAPPPRMKILTARSGGTIRLNESMTVAI
jgi:hypothetical protein